ncbi:MAG: substrate-binding domain-containing protein [Muribaculaceae bacterium]|nr:substrate-binding domain-containing protein [Muribaculaceae bacterium]
MKQIFKFLIISIVVLSFGCNSNKKEKDYRIGISQCSSDPWRWQTNDEIQREMLFHNNVSVEIRSADDISARQISDIKYFIDNNFDLIIVNPNEGDSITPIVNEAFKRGIPVVTFDRRIIGDSYTAHLEVDNEAIGRSAAQFASTLFPNGTPIKILELQGTSTMTPAQLRHKGFVDEVSKYDNIEIVASPHANWRPEDAGPIADSILNQHPEINLIYGHSDPMAIAAVEAARKKGRRDIKAIGIDGLTDVGVKAVADSVLTATFLYPTYGTKLALTAMDILEGRPITRDLIIPPVSAINAKNADILLHQEAKEKEDITKLELLQQMMDMTGKKMSVRNFLLYITCIILVLLLGVVFLLIRAFWVKRQHADALEKKTAELEEEHRKQKELYIQLDEATKSKLVFFTNVSHDLRTPVSLIEEPVARVEKSPRLDEHERYLLHLASKNIRILRRLIDQLLDFRKFENGRLSLNRTEENIPGLIREWSKSFIEAARPRDIEITISFTKEEVTFFDEEKFTMAVDTEKMERVFFNLMSNAMKFTPDNGKINIRGKIEKDDFILSITDSGCGISREDIDKIFDRFYQADRISPQGSGIGLAVSKAFVELHGGVITVESEEGIGTRFTITMPIEHVEKRESRDVDADFRRGERGEEAGTEKSLSSLIITSEESIAEREVEIDESKPLLLAIDDNADILSLIREVTADEYNIVTANNGASGLKLAAKYTPDLILCDVMMPGMDGMECCRRLKEELSTSHIPVLMLTACALDEQRVKGYESGADGYMSKPFTSDLLLARCRNLIANRRRMIDSLTPTRQKNEVDKKPSGGIEPDKENKRKITLSEIDNDFYAKVCDVIAQRISDPELSVEEIAGATGLGQSQFTRKVKAITNYTPVELIRKFRVEKARKLLISTDRTVGEIAFAVGFSSQAYFTRCFRDAYGKTPSEFRSAAVRK